MPDYHAIFSKKMRRESDYISGKWKALRKKALQDMQR
jgi:hypothetical protein